MSRHLKSVFCQPKSAACNVERSRAVVLGLFQMKVLIP